VVYSYMNFVIRGTYDKTRSVVKANMEPWRVQLAFRTQCFIPELAWEDYNEFR